MTGRMIRGGVPENEVTRLESDEIVFSVPKGFRLELGLESPRLGGDARFVNGDVVERHN